MIPYGRQEITQPDIDAVISALKSDHLTQGPLVPRFEQQTAQYCGAKHGVAANSATSALHLACLALGLGHGDWLWTSPITFVASANCGLYCRAQVDFVDIDPVTLNMDSQALARKLERAEKEGVLPKVIVVVHFAGQSADMEAISALARQYGVQIIEDAAHAIGGKYKGNPIGSCTYSDITVFSLHPVKIITSAEGGLALTNDTDLAEHMALLRSHGTTRKPEALEYDDAPWYYEQHMLGFNYRMTDVLAALGNSQLERLDAYVSRRHEIADRYDELLKNSPLILMSRALHSHSALHLYVVQIDPQRTGVDRRTVFVRMREQGIGVNVHYLPVHLQPLYRQMGFGPGQFPAAERYYERALTLPLFPGLTSAMQNEVIAALEAALS